MGHIECCKMRKLKPFENLLNPIVKLGKPRHLDYAKYKRQFPTISDLAGKAQPSQNQHILQ